jgi:hypothetical protein
VRAGFDRRFSARRMAEDYLRAYERIIELSSLPWLGGDNRAA